MVLLGRASILAHEKGNARLQEAEGVARVHNNQGLLSMGEKRWGCPRLCPDGVHLVLLDMARSQHVPKHAKLTAHRSLRLITQG